MGLPKPKPGTPEQCVKCGCAALAVVYHPPYRFAFENGCSSKKFHSIEFNEHLHYVCQTCHYDWTGPTKDQKE